MKLSLFYQLPCAEDQDDVTRYRETIEQVEHGDALGFDCAWLAELHFYKPFSIMPSPLIVATAMAQRTRRIRLGIAVNLLPLWHPLRSAEDGATVDLLSDGRLEFGVGRGAIPLHFAGYDASRDESRERFEESLEIIERAWTRERFSYEGTFYRVPETSVVPRPIQRPHPPIRVAANSPETALFAATKGYPMFVASVTNPLPRMYEQVARYRDAWAPKEGSGRTPDADVSAMFFVHATKDLATARETVEPSLRNYFRSVAGMVRAATVPVETPDSYRYLDEVRASIEDLTFDTIAESMAVMGSAEECADKIRALHERLGMNELICWFNPGGLVPHGEVMAAMSRFADEVAPKIRDL